MGGTSPGTFTMEEPPPPWYSAPDARILSLEETNSWARTGSFLKLSDI